MPREVEITHEPRACDGALRSAFALLGKRWNGILLGTLVSGPAGFAELRAAIGGISDSMLSSRLVELADAGVVAREVETGPPVSVTYRLTPSGEALLPILDQLGAWAAGNLESETPD